MPTTNQVLNARRLVYPIPEKGGLGVHATVDLQDQVRFGPDFEWVDKEDYQESQQWMHDTIQLGSFSLL